MTPRDRYLRQQVSKTYDKVKESGIFLSIVSKAMARDPQALMEIGMAVVLDKPIYLLVTDEMPLPENLRRLARGVEVCRSPEDIQLAAKKLIEQVQRDGFMDPGGKKE